MPPVPLRKGRYCRRAFKTNSSEGVDSGEEYDWVTAVVEHSIPIVIFAADIERIFYEDEEIERVRKLGKM